MTNILHKKLLQDIEDNSTNKYNYFNINKYLGTPNKVYSVPSKVCKNILDKFERENKTIEYDGFMELLDSLNNGKSFEEKAFVGGLLQRYPNHRRNINLENIYKWLIDRIGWCEIDTLCQSTFTSDEIIDRWEEWKLLLDKLNSSENISHRRASLVLLCKACRESEDKKIFEQGIKNIEKVKHEKDILITKAISWLLREMVKYHKEDVKKYLDKNIDKLPKIAIRETMKKINTGKKN